VAREDFSESEVPGLSVDGLGIRGKQKKPGSDGSLSG
jgi:hypothetical protein